MVRKKMMRKAEKNIRSLMFISAIIVVGVVVTVFWMMSDDSVSEGS